MEFLDDLAFPDVFLIKDPYSNILPLFHSTYEVEEQVRRSILGKFLCDSDLLNLWKILYDVGFGDHPVEKDDLSNAVRELSHEIEKIVALLVNDVRESYAVVVAAVVLLSYVYLYLTGCGGWDASRAVSSGPLDYRDSYIAIVLFRGAYVWIKFRDVASTKSKGVRLLASGKYELRFKPRRENGVSFESIYIRRFDSKADAEIVSRMLVSCYSDREDCGGLVDLTGDGRKLFPITPAFTVEEKGLLGEEKHELFKKRVLEHYERYKTEKDALNLPPTLPGANLEQELQNRRLQKENEDLACKLQQSQDLQQALQFRIEGLERQVQHQQAQQNFQQAWQFQFQHLQLQIEDLQRSVQDQQAQQNLQQAQQFQVSDLQLQPQLPHLQQQQREEESLTIDENCDVPFGTEPLPAVPGFWADMDEFINMVPFGAVPGVGAESTSSWGDIQVMDETTT